MNQIQTVGIYNMINMLNFFNKMDIEYKQNPYIPVYPSGYDMITDNVAIGDKYSSYESFDIIVNLNFPWNYVQEKDIRLINWQEKTVYYVGIVDSDEKEKGAMLSLLTNLIPELVLRYQSNPELRILFHCFAGMSRSSTLAIAYLVKTLGLPLDTVYNMVLSKRSIVQPNPLFVKELNMYLT